VTTLEDYLATDFHLEREEIEVLEATLREVAGTFSASFLPEKGYWPYQVDAGEPAAADISHGTTAMVLAAVGKLTGACALASNESAGLSKSFEGDLGAKFETAATTLHKSIRDQGRICSGSFGDNDPFTVSHVTELIRGAFGRRSAKPRKVINDLLAALGDFKAHDELKRLATLDPMGDEPLLTLGQDHNYLKNAFIPLRIVRALDDIRAITNSISPAGPKDSYPLYRRFFEATLHDQLSFSAITDSRFDPAELIFALEGFLHCAPEAVDAELFRRVIDVLEQKQEAGPHWPPSKPIFATQQGTTMLPVSVEGAISLLRSLAFKAGTVEYQRFGPKAVVMLRRFWQWLHARIVRLGPNKIGWHSEHVNEPKLLHIWGTSQVVEFMLGYRELLQRHVAQTTLRLSRVKIRKPKGLRAALEWDGAKDPTWENVVASREPVETLGPDYRVYRRVGEDFVDPWRKGERPRFSMLLYGPPGTGKTSLAEFMADALGFPLLTVTVSDFLGTGDAMVEARAKAIFQMLEAQSNCIILFDEIDSFLLDRDSQHYRDQDTVFKFLTPGMLTKINDLRSAERSIFIIATNYESRIDPAIKRVGRVDEKYLLLPPDAPRRTIILEGLLKKAPMDDQQKLDAPKASLFLGFSDMKAVKKRMGRPGSKGLIAELERSPRSTGGDFYGRRVPFDRPFPVEEARCLYEMAKVAGDPTRFENDFRSAADEAGPDPARTRRALEQLWPAIFGRPLPPEPKQDSATRADDK
jgi:hypothetical protein